MFLSKSQITSLAAAGVHVLHHQRTKYGVRHLIATVDGRQLWTYDVIKYAELRLDQWREQRAQEIAEQQAIEMQARKTARGRSPTYSSAELVINIFRSVQSGAMSVRAAARHHGIPESSLRRLFKVLKAAPNVSQGAA